MTMDLSRVETKVWAVIGAVSMEMGLELFMMFPKSINIEKFKVFLESHRRKYPFDDCLLMLDNLGVHTSKTTKERMAELGYKFAYNAPYTPILMGGIEDSWSVAKRLIA